MNLRVLLGGLWLLAALSPLSAQEFRPLAGHDELRAAAPPAKASGGDKVDCSGFATEGITRLRPGQTVTIPLDLDTFGLAGALNDIRCTGCDAARAGTATLRGDTLRYTGDSETEEGEDRLSFVACGTDGRCSDSVVVRLLVQRAGRLSVQDGRELAPAARSRVSVPFDKLPGGAVCRTLLPCATAYPGRERRAVFVGTLDQGNDYDYTAARAGGTDSVCVILCNARGLCDTVLNTFTIVRPVVELPFFDDFSYAGFRPAAELWQDEDVFVNRSFGQEPPSLGVATFDAADFDGRPYTEAGANGAQVRDFLTSADLNLAGTRQPILSFWLQARGFGNRPGRRDSFLVQFRDREGGWRTVFQQAGLRNTVGTGRPVPFELRTVAIPEVYRYDGFRFRFANKSSGRGVVDNWNLDYVKLQDYVSAGEPRPEVTSDLALTEEPFRVISPYTRIPLRHFQAAPDELFTGPAVLALYNHRDDETTVSEPVLRIRERRAGDFAIPGLGLLQPDFFGVANAFPPLAPSRREDEITDAPDIGSLLRHLNNLPADAEPRVEVEYDLTIAQEDTGFAPGIARNNRAIQFTDFGEEFGYDDGTAEVTLTGGTGLEVVQRYTAYVPDSLVGVSIRIPRGLVNQSGQEIELVVYGGGEAPERELARFRAPIVFAEEAFRDTLQGLTTYRLPEAIELDEGNFFVGWRQLPGQPILSIGVDRNNTTPGLIQFSDGGPWRVLAGATAGVLMIRPLVGEARFTPTGTNDAVAATRPLVRPYPNPTDGRLLIEGLDGNLPGDLDYRCFAASGQLVAAGRLGRLLDLGGLPAGLYLLEVSDPRDPARRSRHKIIRR